MINTNFINDYSKKLVFKKKNINILIKDILGLENKKVSEISIILSNKEYISSLKKEYFNVNHFTDVIAFNLENKGHEIEGEIYISIDDVLENAKIYSTSFNNEFCRVLIHGVLHLIGYNDDTKKNIKIMQSLEEKYLVNCAEEIISLKC